jgi:hypothetical protein
MTACIVSLPTSQQRMNNPTLSPPVELNGDLLVHVFAQVENVLLLGLLGLGSPRGMSSSAAASSSAISTATASASSPECATLRHVECALEKSVESGRGIIRPVTFRCWRVLRPVRRAGEVHVICVCRGGNGKRDPARGVVAWVVIGRRIGAFSSPRRRGTIVNHISSCPALEMSAHVWDESPITCLYTDVENCISPCRMARDTTQRLTHLRPEMPCGGVSP